MRDTQSTIFASESSPAGGVAAAASSSLPGAVAPRSDLPPVLLASTSPRRRQLLGEHSVRFSVLDPEIDDGQLRVPAKLRPEQWAISLAYLKAAAAVRVTQTRQMALEAGTVVVGADTLVVKNNLMVSKPVDAADAEGMLRMIRGGSHRVVTGVAIVCPRSGRRVLLAETALVSVGEVSDQTLLEYVASGQWAGKAGGYNLFERVDAGWPISWEGDPTCIMGLPMTALLKNLAAFAAG